MVIVALGAGLAVLTTVAPARQNLAREIDLRLPERAPSVFFIDIQPDQIGRFDDRSPASRARGSCRARR